MRGLVENIQFLIPLALIIAYRIIRAKNAQNKKQQKQSGGLGELIKKIQEAQSNPDYSKSLTEDTEIYIPPKVPQQQARAAQKPKIIPARQPARPVKPAPKKTTLHNDQLLPETKSDVAAAAKVSPSTSSPSQTGFSLQGLTPLQQAVVWSEILGQPKGVSV